jgi:hypothetical protein
MIGWLLRKLASKFCETHDTPYTSDFCGACIRAREYRQETIDSRPPWTKAEGEWWLEAGE